MGDSLGNCRPIAVIEHCEPEFSPWLILEYRHSSLIYGKEHILFTNIPERYIKIMSRYGRVSEKSIVELVLRGNINPEEIVILDPSAPLSLTYSDLASAKYIVIGGILGDHPPRGRTRLHITSKMPQNVRARNIGNGQYSIDGAIYYVQYLWQNKSANGFKFVDGITIETLSGYIYLPFRYPLINNKPLLADGLEYYLKYRKLREDIWLELTSNKQ